MEKIVCSCSMMPAWLKCWTDVLTTVQPPWGLKLVPEPLEDLEMESNISLSCIHWFCVNVMPFYKWLLHKSSLSDMPNTSRADHRILISLMLQKSSKIHNGSFTSTECYVSIDESSNCCILAVLFFSPTIKKYRMYIYWHSEMSDFIFFPSSDLFL